MAGEMRADAAAPSAPEIAYEWIKQYIVELPREKDAFLNEVMLAKATETSRTPVREALLRLESEGFLRRIPRKGAYVPPISDDDVRGLMDARSLVETWAADVGREAICGGMAGLRQIVEEQRAASGDTARFIELDIEFHSRMVRLARNPLLTDFYDSLRQRQLRVGVRAVSHGVDRPGDVLREHTEILDAIERGEAAAEAIEAHLRSTLVAAIAP